MKYEELKKMMNQLRKEVSLFYGGQLVTIDEAESLAITLGFRFWAIYGKPHWHKDNFIRAVQNTVRNEILRVCA